MKYIAALCLLFAAQLAAQTKPTENDPPVLKRINEAMSGTCQPYKERPKYPWRELAENIKGTVRLAIEVDEAGVVLAVNVETSSGNINLDNAAVSAARKWKLCPELKDGKPQSGIIIVPILFDGY